LLIIGDNVVLCSKAEYTDLGVSRPCVIRTLRPDARIRIGRDTGISGAAICAASSIDIGKECLLGAGVVIADTDFHPIAPRGRRFAKNYDSIGAMPVVIEDNVFIGANTIVLKGVRIGRNSVIGAGSVVSADIPADVVAAGVPARVLKSLGQGEASD
jgi:acetyltransferase-like isoleucine patch superfamily enzyme